MLALYEGFNASYFTVSRYASVPRFRIPEQLDAPALLRSFREHLTELPEKGLIASDVANEIAALLFKAETSADNDKNGAVVALVKARAVLRRSCPDFDQKSTKDDPASAKEGETRQHLEERIREHDKRLAARVLDYDIDFVRRALTRNNGQ